MREDLMCELKGRVVTKDGSAAPEGSWLEFLPDVPMFRAKDMPEETWLAPLGAKVYVDSNGEFRALLTRTDKTGVKYRTSGVIGRYSIELNGPGPHSIGEVLRQKTTRRLPKEQLNH